MNARHFFDDERKERLRIRRFREALDIGFTLIPTAAHVRFAILRRPPISVPTGSCKYDLAATSKEDVTAKNRELPKTQDLYGLNGVTPKQPDIFKTE
jgi:hypothetical protein